MVFKHAQHGDGNSAVPWPQDLPFRSSESSGRLMQETNASTAAAKAQLVLKGADSLRAISTERQVRFQPCGAFQLVMGVPQNFCGLFQEKCYLNVWFRGTPIYGNPHVVWKDHKDFFGYLFGTMSCWGNWPNHMSSVQNLVSSLYTGWSTVISPIDYDIPPSHQFE